jgi:hypothetical protein
VHIQYLHAEPLSGLLNTLGMIVKLLDCSK